MDQQTSLTSTLDKLFQRRIASGNRQMYFSSLLRQSNLPSEVVERALLGYFQSGAIDGTLELQCPECGKDLGEYRRMSEIPEETSCYVCDARIPRSVEYVELVLHLTKDSFFRRSK